jgi:SAM-dependent methyltransferase
MQYDPIKKQAGKIFDCCKFARVVFYRLLDLLLLRSWYIRHEIRKWAAGAPADARILDAGSGFGQYVYYLSRVSGRYRIKGVDVKAGEIEICNRFFGNNGPGAQIKFETADLTTFVEPGVYDLILCIDVMEHIGEDVRVMENLFRSLRKGGTLLISTPSDKGGSDVHKEGDGSFIEEHVRDGYAVEEIEAKLGRAGFRRIESEYSYGKPGQLSWKLSMKYPVKMLNLGKVFFLVLPFYYMAVLPFAMALNFRDLRKKNITGTGLIVKAVR